MDLTRRIFIGGSFWIVCAGALALLPVAKAQDVSLSLEGCPSAITGQAGEIKTFDVFAVLTTANNPSPDGAQAWQLSLTADGGTIKAISVGGLKVSTIFDDDGLEETPLLNPYLFDLADASFKNAQLATFPADGRKGAVSQVFLGQNQKAVLQPNGKERIAKVTVEVKVPAGTAAVPLTLRFEDGFKGSGLAIKNLATFDGVNFRASLGSCTIPVSPLPSFALNFEGLPAVITGSAGEVKTLDVYVTLKTENNTAAYGAQAWQLSLTAEGGRIKSIGVDGVTVFTIFDDDGLPETPPKNPYSFDLANADFKSSQLATYPTDGRKGAISTVFLGQQELNVLQPNGTARIAKLTLEVTIPAASVPASLKLRFEDGFQGSGLPLKNLATIDGVNYRPSLFSSSAVVSPLPTVALGFEGCPSVVSGQAGEVKTFDVFATLSTSTNVDTEGAQAWQLSLTADGGRIKAITVDGVMVSTIFDDDGLPETPPKNPYSFDLANADFKSSQLATFPTDGRKGAISTIFLGQQELNVLQPNGTARLAKVTVEATLPAGPAPATLTLRFEDGFKGSGLPLKNVATFEGVNYRPVLGSCAVDLSASTSNLILPGDCNSDAKIDISDGICLLGYLFTGQTPDLPCDDAGAPTPGSLALMNFNGDAGGLDVTDAIAIFGYLFLGGGPHALGEECRGIAGCPAACQ